MLVACSGGPDSVALAAALHSAGPRMGIDVSFAHVNHGVRSSARQDECIVLQLAAQFGVPLDIVTLQGRTDDEARLRLAALRRTCERRKREGLLRYCDRSPRRRSNAKP